MRGLAGPGVIHQNPPHHLRRHAEEVLARFWLVTRCCPTRRQVGLVDEAPSAAGYGRSARLAVASPRTIARSSSQSDWVPRIDGSSATGTDRVQEVCDFVATIHGACPTPGFPALPSGPPIELPVSHFSRRFGF